MSDTIIKLPNDETLKTRLQKKLEEYRGRMDPYLAPELQQHKLFSVKILEALLKDSEVNVQKLGDEWVEIFERQFDVHAFSNAAGVINAYVTDNLTHVSGGTGLPE